MSDSRARGLLPLIAFLFIAANDNLLAAVEEFVFKGHTGPIMGVAYSPDGKTLATASADKTIRLWDPQTGKLRHTLTAGDGVNAIAFSPYGKLLASGTDDTTVQLWDMGLWNGEME